MTDNKIISDFETLLQWVSHFNQIMKVQGTISWKASHSTYIYCSAYSTFCSIGGIASKGDMDEGMH